MKWREKIISIGQSDSSTGTELALHTAEPGSITAPPVPHTPQGVTPEYKTKVCPEHCHKWPQNQIKLNLNKIKLKLNLTPKSKH